MSKRKPTTGKPPSSRDLIRAGSRHVQISHHGKRDQNGLKPSTSRAILLRNGKYGARGTGELMPSGRITGREKLDLLAEDLMFQTSCTALPSQMDECIKIADSQYNVYLDNVADLKDPDSFHSKVVAELAARTPHTNDDGKQHVRDASHVASIVSTKIHNAYMVASGWKLVIDILRDLQNLGLNDASAHTQLQNDDNLRSRYLVLCDIVGVLVDLGQAHFSILAMTTPHYSRYFKKLGPGESSIGFDWAGCKDACKSFLDSIIIELCFPRAPYPKQILNHILHDAIDESPRETKRFPQSMWDAVGDLSVSLELQELLDGPLLGPQGDQLRTLPRQMPEQYERWLDAQIYSKKASESYANFKDIIHPLERTKEPSVLNKMWKFVDLNYKTTSGLSIDSLWQLKEALRRAPQWSSFYMPNLRTHESDSDGEQTSMPPLKSTGRKGSGGKKQPKKPLEIASGRADDDSDDSMPELPSVSDSSDEDDEDISLSGEDSEEDDGESDYDSEEEEVHRSMLREAMDTAMAIPDFFDPRAKSTVPEFDALAEERRGNPFFKLLGSLRGRRFSPDPKLSSTTRIEPRKGIFGRMGQAAEASAKQTTASARPIKTPDASDNVPPTQPAPGKERQPASAPDEPKDYRATVEGAEDEEDGDVPTIASKKKKKPRKKKKKKKETDELPTTVHGDSVPVISVPPKNLPPSTLTATPAKVPSNKLPESNASNKRGFLSKLSPKEKTNKESESEFTVNKKFTWFTKLGKKTAEHMHQLMRTNAAGSLEWNNFVEVMRDMGFKYDPSTTGSSVRFDPPHPGDRSITFHKPHPDPTLRAHHLREFGKKLKEYYGWSEEDFLRRTNIV